MSLTAVSAVDGRYAAATAPLSAFVSEFALIRFRVRVELEWLRRLSRESEVGAVRAFTTGEDALLVSLAEGFSVADAERVKEIERTTNHDVKAVEYWIKEKLAGTTLVDTLEWVHFACTSEDINNLAHALMLQGALNDVLLPAMASLSSEVADLARGCVDVPMLARTHGQPASPTTMGKELAVFVHRWRRPIADLQRQAFLGKLNGAVGAFNAHVAAFPDADWPAIARRFVESLGLTYNPLTTQIESHDYMAELFHALMRFNAILLDFDRDIWSYISLGYIKQRTVAGEVGSSTMPHKVNPIDFENSEANVGLANAILDHLATKLPVSRLQRDLTDSSAIRNVGSGLAHTLLAVAAARRGLKKLRIDADALAADLDANWEVLAEAIQTVMRAEGLPNPYERLKDLTRGARITPDGLREFVAGLELSDDARARLLALTPGAYTGIAAQLAREILAYSPPSG